jgi:hypothetical protein
METGTSLPCRISTSPDRWKRPVIGLMQSVNQYGRKRKRKERDDFQGKSPDHIFKRIRPRVWEQMLRDTQTGVNSLHTRLFLLLLLLLLLILRFVKNA